MPLVDYARTKRPVFDIDLDAAPYDRWAEVGRRSKGRLGHFMRDIEAMAHDYVDHFVDAAPVWFPDILKPISKSTNWVRGSQGRSVKTTPTRFVALPTQAACRRARFFWLILPTTSPWNSNGITGHVRVTA